jgi:hypothetical protein
VLNFWITLNFPASYTAVGYFRNNQAMMRFLLLFFSCIVTHLSYAGKISGHISDANNQPLAFSSVIIKGTTQGTTANKAGDYSITLPAGNYVFVVQHIGFKTVEKRISVGKDDITIDFELAEQQYDLGTVIVKQGEDPAYGIIRNAIRKRKYYVNEIKKFETEVYIKGQMKIRDYPKKFLGKDVDFGDGDTSKRKMLFLSETVAKYSVDEPKKKVEVISTKVSGDKDAFGFSSPQLFSFYQNTISLGDLNPRGFISPISDNALYYYRYKFEGSFFENNQMINRIKVIPKRKYEPLFNGHINIIENEWRIQSVQLVLFKENQMQLIDTLNIDQLYIPYGNTWIIKQQTISPAIKMFGFDMTGSFVQVYDKFTIDPDFSKRFFNNKILTFEDSANKKPVTYWDSVRPVPLLPEELTDYRKKDSLEIVRKSPQYVDSVNRKRNRPNAMLLISAGQTFTLGNARTTVHLNPLLDNINFNTVEGAVIDFSPEYVKTFSDYGRKKISITPYVRYGFSNRHFNADGKVGYTFGKKYLNEVSVAGGKKVFQFDNGNPISTPYNTITTLLYEYNYMKIYEAWFGRIKYKKELGYGLTASADLQYQDRLPLENTTTTKWRDYEERSFTPNYTFTRHQAFSATLNLQWQPGTQYVQFPEQIVSMGSRYPTFDVTFTRGIKGVFNSDVDYSKWRFEIKHEINLKLFGSIDYNLAAGGFLSEQSIFFPDYTHFRGNLLTIVNPDPYTFLLMPYYAYSNTEKFYSTGHVDYHFNGLLTNKIPWFKRLNIFLVTGGSMLYLKNGTTYSEASVGLENILKVIRIDYVKSFVSSNGGSNGIRVTLPILMNHED